MGLEDQLLQARTEGLLERAVDDEVVVYDLATDEAHLLNPTTAAVWRRCDGSTPLRVIVADLAREHGAAAETMAWAAVEELARTSLLEGDVEFPVVDASSITRRSLLRKIGIGVLAVPVITTIAASPAAAAVSAATCTAGQCNGNVSNCQPTGNATVACGSGVFTGCTCSVVSLVCACR